MSPRLTSIATALCAAALTTALALPLRPYLAPVNLAMLYMLALALVAVAARADRTTAILTALLSVAAFDYFCVPPYLTFAVEDFEYALTFLAMLVIALVINIQTTRIRTHARDVEAREARTLALHQLADLLSTETRVLEAAQLAAQQSAQVLDAQVVIFFPENGKLTFHRRTSTDLPVPASEETLAAWTFECGQKSGLGIDRLPPATAQYVPLRGIRGTLGVMAVIPDSPDALRDHDLLIDLFAHQIALALERTQDHNATQTSRLQMQTEQMRSSLLSAVSHDLRTPLASISGAASTLRESGDRLSPETRAELLDSITEESDRLNRLVRNLLDMTRFTSGAVSLRREACPLEDIVSVALQRMHSQLQGREVTLYIPPDLPPVYVDEVLLGQVFLNMLENAAKYTPAHTPIEISAQAGDATVSIQIRDHGPGFVPGDEQHVFDKFFRRRSASTTGTGLGLAISKAVIEAHNGNIEAFNHPQGGAVFRFSLPVAHMETEQPA